MRKDKLVGAGIFLASIVVAIIYALLLYFGHGSTLAIIFVSAALFVLLGIVGWIGWTMATISAKSVEVGLETLPGEVAKAGKKRRGGPRKKRTA